MRALAGLLFVMAGVGIALRLGLWQLDRAAQKETLQALMQSRSAASPLDEAGFVRTCCADPAALHYRRVRLRGQWLAEQSVWLENRQMNGRPGFFLVTPLRLNGRADAVLVQRGWAVRDNDDRTRVPPVASPSGTVVVDGLIAPPPARLYEFAASASGAIRQNLDVPAFAAQTGLTLVPVSILQLEVPAGGAAPDGLLRDWPQPTVDVQKHYGYAFQWFALGALMTGLYVWFQLVRPRLQRAG
ncbi:MAG: SURF1 family protein [Burkholderiaceae bacterium]